MVHESEAQAACTGAYYWHHWDAQGGTSVPSSYLYQGECGGTLPNPLPSTTRSGYTFTGWYSSSGAQKVAGGGASNAHITFYAGWAENLSISYLSNGGTMTSGGSTSTYVGGTISTLPTVSKTGYTFNGWFQSWGGTQITTSSPHGRTADFMLVASWTANTLNISYYSNGGTTPSGGDSTTTTGGRISSLPTTSRTGYTFNGWYTAPSGGTRITTLSETHGQTDDFTLYAQWTANTLNITYNANGGTTPSGGDSTTSTGGTVSSLATTSRTGYTFAGWYTASSGGTRITTSSPHSQTGDFTLYAQWTANTLNITYNAMGGTTPSGGASTTTTGGTISSLPTTSKTGYTFNGWYTASSGGTRITTSSPHGRTSNFTLYAQWSINWYTFSFDPNGGGNTPVGSTRYYGQSISGTCFITSRTGYSLAGWKSSFDNVTYGSSCSSGTGRTLTGFTMPASNVVFTAQWTADTLTITYNSQSGSAITDGDSTTTTGGSITTLPTDPTRSGYTFAGWYTASSGGTQITAGGAHGQTGNFTLYAQWSLIPVYTLTYDANGGSGSPPSGATAANGVGVTVASHSALSRPGYTFAAWNTAASGTGTGHSSGDTLTMGAANVTLYAQWTADTLTITYDSQSGSPITDGDSATTTGGSITALPTDPTRSGYTFNGWFTATSGGSQITTSNPHGQISDFTLFAQWTQIPVQVAPTDPSVIAPAPPPSSFTIDMGDGSWCLVEHSNERIATDMSVPVGARFSVHGTQFQPDSDIEIWLNSTRVLFGTATAGIDNTFVLTSNLPDQIEPGEHTLGIVGINLAGDLQTTWIGLLVYDLDRVETPDLELPITGRNDAVVLNWSLALLVAGLLVGVLSRRRELLR